MFLKNGLNRRDVDKRVTVHLSSADSLGITEQVDFILAFWMVHEVPDRKRFFNELFSVLKDKGTFLLAEPVVHVTKAKFDETVDLAGQAGFTICGRPGILLSRSVLFTKLPQ